MMIITENIFVNHQSFFVKFFGLIVFSQAVVHSCQAVITCCYRGMIFTENLFANLKCFFVKNFGFIVFSYEVVH